MKYETIQIMKEGLALELCPPDFEYGYYRGTRFDHSGIFRRVVHQGYVLADEWFDMYDPYRHDAVCGPSEEFAESGYDVASVGDLFIKPGVGLLLREDDSPYDHFRLYKVADSGRWTVEKGEDTVRFIHHVDGDGWGYEYVKTVRVIDRDTFEIDHVLVNTGTKRLAGDTYNHNFHTFTGKCPGPEIEIDFPFVPSGTWRSEYDSVALSDRGIRFSRNLVAGESVFMGSLLPEDGSRVTGLVYTQSAGGHSIAFHSDRAFGRITFWSNHKVACIEPFIPYDIMPGDEFRWKYVYKLR